MTQHIMETQVMYIHGHCKDNMELFIGINIINASLEYFKNKWDKYNWENRLKKQYINQYYENNDNKYNIYYMINTIKTNGILC